MSTNPTVNHPDLSAEALTRNNLRHAHTPEELDEIWEAYLRTRSDHIVRNLAAAATAEAAELSLDPQQD